MQKILRLSGLNHWFGSASGPGPGLCDVRVSRSHCGPRMGKGSLRCLGEEAKSFAGTAPVAEGAWYQKTGLSYTLIDSFFDILFHYGLSQDVE